MNLGKKGERLFSNRMIQKGYKVFNTTMYKEFQCKDIDFILTSPTSGDTKSFEVKFDSFINQTNNMFVETANPRSKDGIGWYYFTQADYLAYGDSKNEIFYIIKMQDLRNYIESRNLQQTITGDGAKGFLIALNDIQNIYQVL